MIFKKLLIFLGKAKTIFFVICIFLVSCNNIKEENYFLPANFEGNVAIIFGDSIPKNDNVLNWYIPENGILRTPYKFLEGNYYIHYYQKNQKNKFDTLYEEDRTLKSRTNANKIVFPRVLSFSKGNNSKEYTVQTFYVGKKTVTELANDRFDFEKKLESLFFPR